MELQKLARRGLLLEDVDALVNRMNGRVTRMQALVRNEIVGAPGELACLFMVGGGNRADGKETIGHFQFVMFDNRENRRIVRFYDSLPNQTVYNTFVNMLKSVFCEFPIK